MHSSSLRICQICFIRVVTTLWVAYNCSTKHYIKISTISKRNRKGLWNTWHIDSINKKNSMLKEVPPSNASNVASTIMHILFQKIGKNKVMGNGGMHWSAILFKICMVWHWHLMDRSDLFSVYIPLEW